MSRYSTMPTRLSPRPVVYVLSCCSSDSIQNKAVMGSKFVSQVVGDGSNLFANVFKSISFHSIHRSYNRDAADHVLISEYRRGDAASVEISFSHTDSISEPFYFFDLGQKLLTCARRKSGTLDQLTGLEDRQDLCFRKHCEYG